MDKEITLLVPTNVKVWGDNEQFCSIKCIFFRYIEPKDKGGRHVYQCRKFGRTDWGFPHEMYKIPRADDCLNSLKILPKGDSKQWKR